jgi:hypothetical protein
MNNLNYVSTISQQSREKFRLMKEKMLAPVIQVQHARKETLRNLAMEIEKKQNLFQEKKVSLEKLCRE